MSDSCSLCPDDHAGPCGDLWHALAMDLVGFINRSGETYRDRTGETMHPWQMAQALLIATGSFVDQCWSTEARAGEYRAILRFWKERLDERMAGEAAPQPGNTRRVH